MGVLHKVKFTADGSLALPVATAGTMNVLMPTDHADLGGGALTFKQLVRESPDPDTYETITFDPVLGAGDANRARKALGIGAEIFADLVGATAPDVWLLVSFE